jgi:hypothetical protein
LAEARLLGLWPSQGTYGVWSDALWHEAITRQLEIPRCEIPTIGCDVARFGDDFSTFHVRCGPVSLYHEAVNGWSTSQVAGHLKKLCQEYAAWFNARMQETRVKLQPEEIPVYVDQDGIGSGVLDQSGGFFFVPISAASRPRRPDDYPNLRSELWFATAKLAEEGRLSLARLPRDVLARLRMQCMAPVWKLDAMGRRCVQRKDEVKKAIGRSPDDADGLNLAYFQRDFSVATVAPEDTQSYHGERDRPDFDPDDPRNKCIFDDGLERYQSAQRRRNLFGIRDIGISGDGRPYG